MKRRPVEALSAIITAVVAAVILTACAPFTTSDRQPCDTPGQRAKSVTGKALMCMYVGNTDSKWNGLVFGRNCEDQATQQIMNCSKETHLEWCYPDVY